MDKLQKYNRATLVGHLLIPIVAAICFSVYRLLLRNYRPAFLLVVFVSVTFHCLFTLNTESI